MHSTWLVRVPDSALHAQYKDNNLRVYVLSCTGRIYVQILATTTQAGTRRSLRIETASQGSEKQVSAGVGARCYEMNKTTTRTRVRRTSAHPIRKRKVLVLLSYSYECVLQGNESEQAAGSRQQAASSKDLPASQPASQPARQAGPKLDPEGHLRVHQTSCQPAPSRTSKSTIQYEYSTSTNAYRTVP